MYIIIDAFCDLTVALSTVKHTVHVASGVICYVCVGFALLTSQM